MYIKFCNVGFRVDEKVSLPPKDEQIPDLDKRVRLYRGISAVLFILCVLLLAVILALAVRLSEAWSGLTCLERVAEVEKPAEPCNLEICQTMYPSQVPQYHGGHICSECGKGWVMFENSCYYLSKERLTWQESREQCQKKGGDLVVISNERVQRFLTARALMVYWIGLRLSETQQWTWVNNTALTERFWSQTPVDGDCALLKGGASYKNWQSNPCVIYTHFICQRG